MQILPKLQDIQEIATNKKYNVAPVSCEILSDFTTPIETMRILKKTSKHCYMLESAKADENWGRYTFLGFEPKMEITCIDGKIRVTDKNGDKKYVEGNPSEYLRSVLSEYKSPRFSYLPTFTGGMVGYFAYDFLGYSEPTVKMNVEDTEEFMDMDPMPLKAPKKYSVTRKQK